MFCGSPEGHGRLLIKNRNILLYQHFMEKNEQSTVFKNGHILIVPEKGENPYLLSAMLTEAGYDVSCKEKNLLSLKTDASASNIDLIVFDITLNESENSAFLDFLKKNLAAENLPLVFLKERSDNMIINDRAFRTYYINKPFDKQEFLLRIHTLLQFKYEIDDLKEECCRHKNLFITQCSIMKSLTDSMIIISKDGTIQKVNEATCKMLHYNEQELLGKHIDTVIDLSDLFFRNEWMRYLVKMETIEDVERTYLTKSGEKVPVIFSSSTVRNSEGHFEGITCMAHDISARKRVENELNKAQKYAQSLIDCSLDLIVATDLKGRITEFNKSAQKTFGYNIEDVVGKDIEIIFYEAPEAKNLLHELNERGRVNKEIRGRISSGEILPLYTSASSLIDSNGERIGYLHVSHDITELKKAELIKENLIKQLQDKNEELKASQTQLIQSEKMAAIGQLAAGIVHEINNPLGFVSSGMGNLGKFFKRIIDFIEKHETFQLPPDIIKEIEKEKERINYDYLKTRVGEIIENSKIGINRMKEIILDLKTFSRVDASELTETDINGSIDTTLGLLIHEFKNRVEIVKEYGNLPLVSCYSARLNQVFMNLFINASHAIDGKGVIKIRTSKEKESVRIDISDSGKGIPEDIKSKVFEPFFTTKPVGKGTGFGLSISAEIIKEHGGTILLDSIENKGTTFTITLPLNP